MKPHIRRYIRHPSTVPVNYRLGKKKTKTALSNIGGGGLCFTSAQFIQPGEAITISLPVSQPPFDAEGSVSWCIAQEEHFLVGVMFSEQAVKNSVRMMEQICYIENYRTEMRIRRGIELSSEEAAQQWIALYAATFPGQLE